ncbi:CarboxypepD_reg-like domain-containing protein [Flavobacterium chilense]|uniref:CarboxypepD_reg-like domain-containing protein n=2 Tax=Flavobacterium chilense TaxID=946677 RepID=A0A1M7GB19_9FLAO|nr:CarboxypepD_reg-like domain-containing protein [Flavobacterium chilense]
MRETTFMKNYTLIAFLFFSISNFAQIKGTITDEKGNPLPFVSVFEENTYSGTTSNEQGKYQLNVKEVGKNKIIFQYLGFKTQKITVSADAKTMTLDVKMLEESFALNEVVIDPKNNPANAIIRNAIANKKDNSDKTARYTADFYSKGMFKVKDLPKKILGKKVDLGQDMASNLDSTGTGILYLSETISKITFEKPNKLKEKIIASRISGNNKGYSYNTASLSTYDFYENTLDFDIKLISPIADNAFSYYKYKLEGTFFDENNHQINKIKVIPKRDKEPVFEGYIYIVDDSFAIYAIDLDIKGYRMKNEFTEVMQLNQSFSYNTKNKIWTKNAQTLDFTAGIFGIKFSGKFNYVYSNYEFPASFEKKTFGNEIVAFEANANKKDDAFWNEIRPIPLTIEEKTDYTKKDSLQTIRKSQKYTDSIDAKTNKFKITDVLMGYGYKNTFKKYSFDYKGLLNLTSLSFNTVQGFNLDSGFSFKKGNEEEGKTTSVSTTFNYGFSDQRFRAIGQFTHKFNNINYATISASGGTKVAQFNSAEPISKLINSVSSLFYKDNYMKLYNLEFAQVNYSQNILNGIKLIAKAGYEQRKPLFNTTDYSFFKRDDQYSSNNPQAPNDFTTPAFDQHHLFKTALTTLINFGTKYISRPDGRYNVKNDKYPTLSLTYEKAFAASEKKYEFERIGAFASYDLSLGNKGILGMNLRAGKFFNAENISFIDYRHFNGNQTHIGTSNRYLNVFNLMPYYTNSTNDSYFEMHLEHNDMGFVTNKIPLINLLKSTMNIGFHSLAIPDRKPYSEFTVGLDNLGFGKFKIFRLDYVHSYQGGIQQNGVVFGLKILNALN